MFDFSLIRGAASTSGFRSARPRSPRIPTPSGTALIVVVLGIIIADAASAGGSAELSGNPSLCDRLGARAGEEPVTTRLKGDDPASALRPWLALESPGPAALSGIQQLAELPEVKQIQTSPIGPQFEHLPGTDIFMVQTIGGTANCEQAVFIEAKPGHTARVIAKPRGFGASGLCWYAHGDLGRVFGVPAYVEAGEVSMTNRNIEIRITPLTGADWGESCKLDLQFQTLFKLTEHYCGDEAVCPMATAVAIDIARSYLHHRNEAGGRAEFSFGASPGADAVAAALRAKQDLTELTGTAVFPTFGQVVSPDAQDYSYSYSGFAYFPLMLGGRAFVAAVGHAGIGWREYNRTLFAVYDTALVPLASFVILESRGPMQVVVDNGGSAQATH